MPPQSRYEYLLNNAHQNVGDFLNKALAGLETGNTSLYDVLEHINFTRKVGQSKIPDIKLRQLITHFSLHRNCTTSFTFVEKHKQLRDYFTGHDSTNFFLAEKLL